MQEWIDLRNFCLANGLTPAEVRVILEKAIAERAKG